MEVVKFIREKIIDADSSRLNLILHLFFWILYFALSTFISTQTLPLKFAVQRNVLIVVFNALVFYINYLWIMPEYFERGDFRSYTLAMIGMMLLATPVQYIVEMLVFDVPEDIKLFTYNVRYIVLVAITCFIFLVLSTLLKMSMSRNFLEKELLELKANKFEAELKFLREQINPHFLFNSINNIYSLSLENSPKTPEMILKMSELLRYMLYESNQPKVKLESEVQCIYSLVDLFQIKFDEKLNIRIAVKGINPAIMIVPNLFNPLIENAFKHGNFGVDKNAYMNIELYCRYNYIYFKITNSFNPDKKTSHQPGGIGLANLRRRFQINYEPSGRIKFKSKNNEFSVVMVIPIID